MKHSKPNTDKQSLKAQQTLYKALALIKTPEEARLFLEDLCTPTEIQAMTDRFRVVGPIQAGIPYRTIYEETGVSVTTIGRVARNLLLGAGGYQLIRERLEKTS